ncbi:MAG: hypothetical protein M0Q87_12110 [Ottowia sp.]|nr:hypothetical protein [Ottowia sp.]
MRPASTPSSVRRVSRPAYAAQRSTLNAQRSWAEIICHPVSWLYLFIK